MRVTIVEHAEVNSKITSPELTSLPFQCSISKILPKQHSHRTSQLQRSVASGGHETYMYCAFEFVDSDVPKLNRLVWFYAPNFLSSQSPS